ncbi:MAG: hypothetical protein A3C15_00660 [Candidatus Magasanikbacteria bacterium RIFCSPHIGHO2_02_FULL_50_9b]|uniref:Zeta toxin domain-containing protein n=1 Tax=Candidatus Magasanikbacteria bacterium RIFCSPHIGHO2_02_FULL_50_9b TaxID=1798682 RepID=A0A1F6M8W9_9BACT|nr:MAG: hypothetical protein A3C15_00660 [Candidatus Magasanikbacteria bacterium RIFCSPHIGHO2_02_FULL_50_9b]
MGDLTYEEQKLCEAAKLYVKTHAYEIVERFAGTIKIAKIPVSIFTAGSPGAGKTEFANKLIADLKDFDEIIHIDADEIRKLFPGYVGTNSHIFQSAASTGVNKIFDHAIDTKKSCLLDGTFAYVGQSRSNVERSLNHDRAVLITYIYQDPVRAWEFTKKREVVEGRRVSKEKFIEQFFAAPLAIADIKNEFGDRVRLWVVTHDYDKKIRNIKFNASIDDLPEITYSKKELESLLKYDAKNT